MLATAGGMSPPEVEKLVTRPIEIQMGGLPRLAEVRSVSKIGLGAITIVFEDGVNDYFARQLVSERLARRAREVTGWSGAEFGRSPPALARSFNTRLSARIKSMMRPNYARYRTTSFVPFSARFPVSRT